MKNLPRSPDDTPNIGEQRPLREVAWLLSAAILLAGSVAFVLAWFAESIVTRISVESEREIFAPLVPSMLESLGGATANPEADEALAAIFATVANATPELPYDWQVRVLCDEAPNAFALPGGAVGVTSGLLARLDDEAQLAFVLGHELGHFIHRDQLRGLGRRVAVGVVFQGLLSMGGVDAAPAVGAAIHAAQSAHDRDQETEADQVGLTLLHASRGHVMGARSVLQILAEAGDESWVDRLDFTRTHPVGEVRIARLQALIDQHQWPTHAAPTPLPTALRAPCP